MGDRRPRRAAASCRSTAWRRRCRLTVVASEDGRFCSHRGVDWQEIRDRLDEVDDISEARGVSTITQQTAKNLFLWPGRSFVRKALEFPLALWIDLVLPKWRVLEIYLNIAEWGPNGQFGAEAGSRYAFNKSVRALSAREAALLAAVLPNPRRRSAKQPGPAVRRLAARYETRAAAQAALASCVRPASVSLALAQRSSISRLPPTRDPLPDTREIAPDQEHDHGRPQEKNLTFQARDAPLRRRAQAADLCRGQGFGRAAPAAPHRPQDRHVPRPPDPQAQVGS